jgi:hypothetical protein
MRLSPSSGPSLWDGQFCRERTAKYADNKKGKNLHSFRWLGFAVSRRRPDRKQKSAARWYADTNIRHAPTIQQERELRHLRFHWDHFLNELVQRQSGP